MDNDCDFLYVLGWFEYFNSTPGNKFLFLKCAPGTFGWWNEILKRQIVPQSADWHPQLFLNWPKESKKIQSLLEKTSFFNSFSFSIVQNSFKLTKNKELTKIWIMRKVYLFKIRLCINLLYKVIHRDCITGIFFCFYLLRN